MSTTQELLAANERYDALVRRIEAEVRDCEMVIGLPKSDEWDRGYRAGAQRMKSHLLTILALA